MRQGPRSAGTGVSPEPPDPSAAPNESLALEGAYQIATARRLWEARPIFYYAWSSHEHHANATEIARAIAALYALTGRFDREGGNVLLPTAPTAPITAEDLPAARQIAPAIGLSERPLGPARSNNVSLHDFYRAVQTDAPYPMRGLIGFGANLLLWQGDPNGGRAALAKLDFYAHADLFMNPRTEMAGIVFPIASGSERAALKIGLELSAAHQSHAQFRPAVVPPSGEARSDTDLIFVLAARLGLTTQFWDGDVDAAYRHQRAPSGISLDQLRAQRGGISVKRATRVAQPAWATRYPLVLTCAKPTLFGQTQHRALPSLRKRAQHPEIEIHLDTGGMRARILTPISIPTSWSASIAGGRPAPHWAPPATIHSAPTERQRRMF